MSKVELSSSLVAIGVAVTCALTGCGAPNSKTGLGGGLGAADPSNGTTTSTTTTNTTPGNSAFSAPKQPNHQAVATPNSALVVYLPPNPAGQIPQQLTLSPASGYPIAHSLSTDQRNREVATVSLSANLKDTRSISTAIMDQPLTRDYYDPTTSSYDGKTSGLRVSRSSDGSRNASSALTDAYYGILYVGDPVVKDAAVIPFHGGSPTPVSRMPTTASATYSGYFVGTESRGNNSLNLSYWAPMQMTANFASGTVNGSVIRPNGMGDDAQFGIAFNGAITGNAFEGTASMVSAPGKTVTTGGALNGAFYGANASQAAGAITVQGTQNFSSSPNSPVTVYGSFGAKR